MRRKGREVALKLLFESTYRAEEFAADVAGEIERFADVHGPFDGATTDFAEHLVRGVLRERDAIDAAVAGAAQNWRFDRIGLVEKTILRIGAFEMEHPDQRGEREPKEIVIDEAVELAKIYASDDAPAFINGILDALAPDGDPASCGSGEPSDIVSGS